MIKIFYNFIIFNFFNNKNVNSNLNFLELYSKQISPRIEVS